MPTPFRKAQNRFSHHALNALVRLAPALPVGVATGLDRALGGALARAQPRGSRVLRHLRLAFGDELGETALRRVAADFYRHASHLLFEVLQLGRWSNEELLAATEVVGIERLEAAKAQGRGVIIIGGHLGNFEIGGAGLGRRGHPLAVVSEPQRNPELESYLDRARSRHGVSLIHRESLRDCFACLRGGGLLVLLIDQRPRRGGVIVPFFGHPAASAPGPAALAMKTGAPVLPLLSRRIRDDRGRVRHRVEVGEAVELVETGDREQDILLSTARFQAAIEAGVRAAPEQWLWTLNRWGLRMVEPRRKR